MPRTKYEHLADQLLIPCALAGGGDFQTTEPSLHARTNAEVIARFLEMRCEMQQAERAWTVQLKTL